MAQEPSIGAEQDPEKTDSLPALAGAAGSPAPQEASFASGGRLDPPRLAAKMQSVEERVAREAADYALLSKKLERAQDSEAAAVSRANALAVELAAVRAAFEAERTLKDALAARVARAESERAEVAAQQQGTPAAEIAALKTALETSQEEVTVLLAHLQAARRQESEPEAARKDAAERKQLSVELAARSARVAALEQENRELRATLERTRGALGRLQNTIERLGDVAASEPSLSAVAVEAPVAVARATDTGDAEGAPGKLVRVDGGHAVTYVLQRRNQVGRAPGTEVHIDSSTVSRLHALIVSAPGGAIIEDVKSTNGTYVNGRRVTRQLLRDGDLLTIGEAQFRFVAETRKKPPVEPNPPPGPVREGPVGA